MDSKEEILKRLLERSKENSRQFNYIDKGAVSKRREELEKIFEEEFENYVASNEKDTVKSK